jgi:ectoine hydroxylase-related dioxygenase (phytanoyl-CoA dioxygenase family)
MLDDYTPDNGALGLVPGSHRRAQLPRQALADHPEQVLVTGRAGTVVVLNAQAWHAGTANRTGRPRRALHAFSRRRDRPRQQDQRQLPRPGVQRSLPPDLRELLALDDPLNGRLGAAAAVRGGFL